MEDILDTRFEHPAIFCKCIRCYKSVCVITTATQFLVSL